MKPDAEAGIAGKDKVEFVLDDNDSQLEFANVFFDVRENVRGTNAVVTVQRTGPQSYSACRLFHRGWHGARGR